MDTRAAVLKALADLGHETSLKKVARHMGTTYRTIQKHFSKKEIRGFIRQRQLAKKEIRIRLAVDRIQCAARMVGRIPTQKEVGLTNQQLRDSLPYQQLLKRAGYDAPGGNHYARVLRYHG